MTDNEKAAIIGHWRCGASYFKIGNLYWVSPRYVEMIIDEYLKKTET